MKKLFIIVCLVALGAAAHAQAGYQTMNADTVKGAQTHYITSTSGCPYYGYISFDYTIKGFGTGDSAYVQLQGKNQGTTWIDVGSKVGYGSNASIDKQVTQNPSSFLNYRLKITGKTGDTVRVSAPLFIYKR
jgi:hypothetical protein